MRRSISAICLAVIMLGDCARTTDSSLDPPGGEGEVERAEAAGVAGSSGDCTVSPTMRDEPPKDPSADPFGDGPWYINADRTMWAGWGLEKGWQAGPGLKTIWIRPAGADLTIHGRRLDGESPPLEADIPCCYPTGFQVVGLLFPSEGCWEVTATAGLSELRFVTSVLPAGSRAGL